MKMLVTVGILSLFSSIAPGSWVPLVSAKKKQKKSDSYSCTHLFSSLGYYLRVYKLLSLLTFHITFDRLSYLKY
jgi:hypothetical protein